jgi:hypothetical protein
VHARTVIRPPSGVNFTALLARLKKICLKRIGSAVSAGRPGATSTWRVCPFWLARPRAMTRRSSKVVATERDWRLRTIFPASTLERSRMSLMSWRRCWPLV